jgi:hypothetical protein
MRQGGAGVVEAEVDRPRGVTGLAWRIDLFLKERLGWPYRMLLAIGLMVGLSQSASTLTKAIGSPTNIAATVVTVVFQAALLINQLAQVNQWRHEQRLRRARRKG